MNADELIAADKHFGSSRRPTIAETAACYRERRIGLVMFTVKGFKFHPTAQGFLPMTAWPGRCTR